MKYMGSKNRISKFIAPIIQKEIDKNPDKLYIEPFCGGCNMIDKLNFKQAIAADLNQYLIALFSNLYRLENILPDKLSREDYESVKTDYKNYTRTYKDWYIGAIGFLGSYNGKFFDGRIC